MSEIKKIKLFVTTDFHLVSESKDCKVGDIIETDPAMSQTLASIGCVRIIVEDEPHSEPPSDPQVVETHAESELDDVSEEQPSEDTSSYEAEIAGEIAGFGIPVAFRGSDEVETELSRFSGIFIDLSTRNFKSESHRQGAFTKLRNATKLNLSKIINDLKSQEGLNGTD